MTQQKEKTNKLDEGVKVFIDTYRYELLASLVLITVLAGIISAVIVFRHKTPQPVFLNEGDSQTEVKKGDSKIKIDVSGAVASPGVVELDDGARLSDVIESVGGMTEEANQGWVDEYLNMAKVVKDGEKVFIPFQKDSQSALDQSNATNAKVNINTATQEELITLPGIGAAYAQRIIDARPFTSVDQLLNVSGIGEKRFEQIRDKVTVY